LPTPFWGYIGAKDDIDESKLLRDYTGFYSIFLESGNLQNALDALQYDDPKYAYVFMNAEFIFDMFSDGLRNLYPTKEQRFQRLLPQMKEIYPELNELQQGEKLWELIANHDEKKFYQKVKDIFLMKY